MKTRRSPLSEQHVHLVAVADHVELATAGQKVKSPRPDLCHETRASDFAIHPSDRAAQHAAPRGFGRKDHGNPLIGMWVLGRWGAKLLHGPRLTVSS